MSERIALIGFGAIGAKVQQLLQGNSAVELVADAYAAGNIHELEAQGTAGNLRLSILGHADPDNPKTSMLTAYSVVRAIENRGAAFSI